MNILAVGDSGLPEFPTFVQLLREHPALEHWLHFLIFWEDVIYSILIGCIISFFFYLGAQKQEMIPRGLQNFVELIVETLRKILKSILGSDADRYLPFLGTLFIYIFAMNSFGLIPFMKSPSSSVSITIAMGLCVFFYVQYLNFKNMGFFGYLYHLAGSPNNLIGWLLVPLMLPIELITQISRPVTLALRLTGNVMGEHVLVGISALFAILIFSFDFLPFGLPIQIPAMLFGLVTSFIQGMVFTLLSSVYIYLTKPHEHE